MAQSVEPATLDFGLGRHLNKFYLFEKERDSKCKQGKGQRGKERRGPQINSASNMEPNAWGSISQPSDYDLSGNQAT